jgi:hypothetical protein
VYDTVAAAKITPKAPREFRGLSGSGLKTLTPALLKTLLPSFDEVTASQHFDIFCPPNIETISYA